MIFNGFCEALKLKDVRRQLPDMRSMHLSLQEKHEALELELSTAAQRASTLEGAVARLREDIQAVPAAEGKTCLRRSFSKAL